MVQKNRIKSYIKYNVEDRDRNRKNNSYKQRVRYIVIRVVEEI